MREEILKIALKAWWNTLPLDAPERQVYELVKQEAKPIIVDKGEKPLDGKAGEFVEVKQVKTVKKKVSSTKKKRTKK